MYTPRSCGRIKRGRSPKRHVLMEDSRKALEPAKQSRGAAEQKLRAVKASPVPLSCLFLQAWAGATATEGTGTVLSSLQSHSPDNLADPSNRSHCYAGSELQAHSQEASLSQGPHRMSCGSLI